MDRVELMTALLGAQSTLKFLKAVKHSPIGASNAGAADDQEAAKVVFPFFVHADFSLCPKSDASNFELKLAKLQNGLFRFERNSTQDANKAAKQQTVLF